MYTTRLTIPCLLMLTGFVGCDSRTDPPTTRPESTSNVESDSDAGNTADAEKSSETEQTHAKTKLTVLSDDMKLGARVLVVRNTGDSPISITRAAFTLQKPLLIEKGDGAIAPPPRPGAPKDPTPILFFEFKDSGKVGDQYFSLMDKEITINPGSVVDVRFKISDKYNEVRRLAKETFSGSEHPKRYDATWSGMIELFTDEPATLQYETNLIKLDYDHTAG